VSLDPVELGNLVASLPAPNYVCLRYLVRFLSEISLALPSADLAMGFTPMVLRAELADEVSEEDSELDMLKGVLGTCALWVPQRFTSVLTSSSLSVW
jgi:hypothetical protein